jgi:two-component system response regulator ResD
MTVTILIVDDEEPMRELVKVQLIGAGFQVEEAHNGIEALEMMKHGDEYSAIILDWMMPFLDGIEVTKRIREYSSVPIIMLTARNETEEKVASFTSGADDYVTKPFEGAELIARIRAVLRRSTHRLRELENNLQFHGLSMDQEERTVWFEGESAALTQNECELLALFLKHPKLIYSRQQLIDFVWGVDFLGDERTVDSHIRNLRSKLRTIGATDFIKTIWGVGYQFV